MKSSLELDLSPELKIIESCSLCGQEISPNRQMPLNAIIIEGYAMCPNCCQTVRRETEDSYQYRCKWLRHVNEISKRKGWDWQYRPGKGFEKIKR